ncbi:hypothetical protein D9619_001355 [Psilocybe cf. subviscida]|uniref:N-alpha-acetyltransferase 60 n=1 Tax=Psilocybe cf. subviscida TaxID=2480587 RepID=A0A8H5F2R2_9AGAR|nr:hypothetical protein D9619_001355 [Psilocybe cf. subviscida]
MPPTDIIVIRRLTARDVPKLRELHSKILPVQYPASFFLQLLVLPARACFVACRQPYPGASNAVCVPIGFISAAHQPPAACFTSAGAPIVSGSSRPTLHNLVQDSQSVPDAQDQDHRHHPRVEILTLGVLPAYQQAGIARRLVHCVVDAFRDESCAVNSSLDQDSLCALDHKPPPMLIYANVSTKNDDALLFYERIGMAVAPGVLRGLYKTAAWGTRDAYLVVGVV